MTLDEAIQHAREMATKEDACGSEHEQLASWLEELVKKRQRIDELVEMLNKAQEVARIQVENERDACERAVQFLLNVADGSEPGTERTGSDDYLRALTQAVNALQARKDPGVQAISEMAHGSMIGEYVQACVEEALVRERAKFEAPPADRPDDESDFHPGWHGTSFIAEANMANREQLVKDAAELDDLAETGYYDDTENSGSVLKTMATWLRRMAGR